MKLSKSRLTIRTKSFETPETPYPEFYSDFYAHLQELKTELIDFYSQPDPTFETNSFETSETIDLTDKIKTFRNPGTLYPETQAEFYAHLEKLRT